MQMDVLLAYGWQGLFLASWVGLAVGSFLNVVIYRLPVILEREWRCQASEILELSAPELEPQTFNLSVPRSRCPHCGHQIRWYENIPVFSWLVLRGRCSACQAGISVRYPTVELATGILTLLVISNFGFTMFGLAAVVLTWYLIALTLIDFDTQLLPDQMTVPLMWFGLAYAALGPAPLVTLTDAVIGAIVGYLSLWVVYWVFKLLTGKEGFGYGDFKLLAALGAWLGWQVMPGLVLLSAILGLVFALPGMLLGQVKAGKPIPFGPAIAVAGWLCLMFRDIATSAIIPI